MIIIQSVDGVPIRVTHERLVHIYDRHPEMKGHEELIIKGIGDPEYVQEGDFGARLGIRSIAAEWPLKYVVVVYKELSGDDGFLLTAYFTRKPAEWRRVVWKR